MILNLLISTIDKGIGQIPNIILPTIREDVRYIVSHQYRDEKYKQIPQELIREDVIISQIKGQGLTKSRNNAMLHATLDICVIADDDVKYTHEYLDKILYIYQKNDVDVALFKIFTGEMQPAYKHYPTTEIIIDNLSSYSPSSIEITFKLSAIRDRNILFDERFGLGTTLIGGEEGLFLRDCTDAGLKIKFFPFYIVNHPFESTVKALSKYNISRVRVGGALDARVNGNIAYVKAFAGTLKLAPDLFRNKKSLISYLCERLSGVVYILKSNKKQ